MKFLTVLFYFILVVVALSSIGVLLPWIFDLKNENPDIYKNFNQNIITYFIAILMTSSLDIVMKTVDTQNRYKKPILLFISIVNLLILSFSGITIYDNYKGEYNKTPIICYLGVTLAYIAWWFANYNNSTFKIDSTLGGNPNKPLSNG